MFPILQVGPLAVQTPGLLVLAGVWLGSWLLDKEAVRLRLPAEALSKAVLIGLVSGVLGARLWYALRYLDVYLDNPLGLLSLNPVTLAATEGVFTGIGAAVAYAASMRLLSWDALDALALGVAVFAVAAALSRLASGDGFGAPASVPWAVELWGARRHPTQIYELLAAGISLWAIWKLGRRPPFAGFTALAYVALAAGSRVFLEGFRGDSVIVLGSLRSAQLLGLIALALALLGLHLRAGVPRQRIPPEGSG